MTQVVVLFALLAATAAFFNWRATEVMFTALKDAAAEALTPVWAAATRAAPEVWRVAPNPVNLLLYLIVFSALVKYPHIMAGVVAALSGSAQPPAGAAGT